MKLFDRRKLLISSAMGMGSLPLRALITGLPATFLTGLSRPGFAQSASLPNAKFLILSHESAGDPLNANAPGTYAANPNDESDPLNGIERATVAEAGQAAESFAEGVNFRMGSQRVRAAAPWSNLDRSLRDRMAVWHHATNVNAHPEFKSVRLLNGALKAASGNGSEELGAFIAENTHESLGTIMQESLTVGGSAVTVQSRPLPVVRPLDVKSLFVDSSSSLSQMISLRDQFVDQAYSQVKATGTPAQQRFFDSYARSSSEAKAIGEGLGDLISGVDSNSMTGQVKMAVALIQLRVSPVITLGLDFGGDNHGDPLLEREVNATRSGLSAMNLLWQELNQANLQDEVAFAVLNTFGRTLKRNRGGGRDHYGRHHAMAVFGDKIEPGVIGGLEEITGGRRGNTLGAAPINSNTGGTANPNIPYNETLSAVAKTLSKACGLPNDVINSRIDGGRIIGAALKF